MARKTLKRIHKSPTTWWAYAGTVVTASASFAKDVFSGIPRDILHDLPHVKAIGIVLLGVAVISAIVRSGGQDGDND